MTEGIIQKVIREYIDTLNNIPWDKKDLNELQNKLIEAIEKELPYQKYGWHIRRILIGDNQE